MPSDAEHVKTILRRALARAKLVRIPKNPEHRDVVLAIFALTLQRRYPYSEIELNDVLNRGLTRFNATVDHVTCRRYLVDCGFVKRDRAGERYFLNYPRLAEVTVIDSPETAFQIVDEVLTETRNRSRKRQV